MWGFLELWDLRGLLELRVQSATEGSKVVGASRDPRASTESPVFQGTPERRGPQETPPLPEGTSSLRWFLVSIMRSRVLLGWFLRRGERPVPEGSQGLPELRVLLVGKESTERPENLDQWENQDLEVLKVRRGNQDLTDYLDLREPLESQDSPDRWEEEELQDYQDSRD